jgi:hypothetical protein
MSSSAFIDIISNPLRFRLYLLTKIPSAFFSGLRIHEINEDQCKVKVPHKWFTRNPFHSTYFACLGMAAEMSTGALAMAQVYKSNPPVSTLVIGMEANFLKKATGEICFHCLDGHAIRETIAKALSTGEGHTVKARSVGYNGAGEPVAEFFITWSFKVKSLNKVNP